MAARKVRAPGLGKKVKMIVAKGTYDLAPGTRAKVRVRLTKNGKWLLRRSAKVKAIVTARASVPTGLTTEAVLVIKRRRR